MQVGMWIALLSNVAVAVSFGSIAVLAAIPSLLWLRFRRRAGAPALGAGDGPAAQPSPAP